MKNILLLAGLFLVLFSACTEDSAPELGAEIEVRDSPECDFEPWFVTSKCDDCCWTFDIYPSGTNGINFSYYQLRFPGSEGWQGIKPIGPNGSQDEICFDKDVWGLQGVYIELYDEFYDPICHWDMSIDIQPCETPAYWICWEDFIGYFDCATSITLLIDGEEETFDFSTTYPCDVDMCVHYLQEPCDICPCSVPTPVEGGFCCIFNQVTSIIESLGYEVTLSENDPFYQNGACQKQNEAGTTDVPGFYFISDVPIVSINGNDCNGSQEIEVLLETETCE